MSGGGLDNSGDLADVFDCVFEENQSHVSVVVVVLLKSVLDMEVEFVVGHEVVLSFSGNTLAEVAEDELFGVGGLEVSLKVKLGEGLLQ
jgi:hypothetical protein